MTVGVLALQGDFEAHCRRLDELGAVVRLVRRPDQLGGLDGLVIPGGESSTMLKLLDSAFLQRLRDFVRTKPVLATCAGTILVAREVENPEQASLGALDIRVQRNGYGRQIHSSVEVASRQKIEGRPLELVFIRAPKIVYVGPGVEVLATRQEEPVLVRQGDIIAATFHPELSADSRIHELFLAMAG
jgi:pyridoxal 5'-phosphate synthase pdxT subunit